MLSLTGLSQVFKNWNLKAPNKKEVKMEKRIKISTESQSDLTGTWYWENSSNGSNTELYLTQNGNSVIGKHCSSFFDGSKIDCADEGDTSSISLIMTSPNVFEGTVKSTFSNVEIPVKITLNTENSTIFFQQLFQPTKEYYLPNNVSMTLAQD